MTIVSDRRIPAIASDGSREAIWIGVAWYLTGVVLWWFGAFSGNHETGARLPALAAAFIDGVVALPPP